MHIIKKTLSLIIILFLSSCSANVEFTGIGNTIGNIHNGGYVIEYENKYLYTDMTDCNYLYITDKSMLNKKKVGDGHYHYELNLCGDYLYYISGYPGNLWRISLKTYFNCNYPFYDYMARYTFKM